MDENVSTGKELIAVTQLAVIEDQLATLHRELQSDLRILESLVPTDENYKELKKVRAEWNKKIDALETARKRVKAEIEAPYKQFESGPYKELLTDIRKAVGSLDAGIKEVEGLRREAKQEAVNAYFAEYRESIGLDAELVPSCPIAAGMSDSIKSLKTRAKDYLDGIQSDLTTVESLENRDEIMAEYRRTLNLNAAIQTVKDRLAREEAVRMARTAAQEAARAREEHEAAIDAAIAESSQEASTRPLEASQGDDDAALSAPVAQAADPEAADGEGKEPVYQASFRVTGTLQMLRELKAFLVDGGYQYETIKGGN